MTLKNTHGSYKSFFFFFFDEKYQFPTLHFPVANLTVQVHLLLTIYVSSS